MESNVQVDILVDYIKNKVLLDGIVNPRITYEHMSAVIIDSILQSGLRYDTIVRPRVNAIIEKYHSHKTTSQFILLYNSIPLSRLISWNNEIKLNRIVSLSNFFFLNDIETVDDLNTWFYIDDNKTKMRQINGIGPKTIDYIMMLVGHKTIPIDRHLFNFAERIGYAYGDYEEISSLYNNISNELDISPAELDNVLWNFLKTNKDWKSDLAYQMSFV